MFYLLFSVVIIIYVFLTVNVNAQQDNSKKASEQKFLVEPRFIIVAADGESKSLAVSMPLITQL